METQYIYSEEHIHHYPPTNISGNARVHFGDRFYKNNPEADAFDQLKSSLLFPEILSRYETIEDCHGGTCEWVLGIEDPGNSEEPRSEKPRWDDFGLWLEQKDQIYWISGKPGSGKSTLVKYLVETLQSRQSSNDNSSKVLSFWFWEAGTELQKSWNGCMRSILWQLLQGLRAQDPLPQALRQSYQPGLTWTKFRLTKLLKAALDSLQADGVQILLFLDGLDEAVSDSETILSSLELLLGSLPLLKACISSRPESQFVEAFSKYPKLRLQDLNENDINKVINETFLAKSKVRKVLGEDTQIYYQLGNSLKNKAEGVFLWVHLTIRDLLRGITNRDDAPILLSRVENLPTGLTQLYNMMLRRNGDSIQDYRKEAALYIHLIQRTGDMALIEFCLAVNDPCRKRFLDHPVQWDTLGVAELGCETAELWIPARTGGLLEVVSYSNIYQTSLHRLPPNGALSKLWLEHHGGKRLNSIHRNQSTTNAALSKLWLEHRGKCVDFIHRTALTFLKEANHGIDVELCYRDSYDADNVLFESMLVVDLIFKGLCEGSPSGNHTLDGGILHRVAKNTLKEGFIVLTERVLKELHRRRLLNVCRTFLWPATQFSPAFFVDDDGHLDFCALWCNRGWSETIKSNLDNNSLRHDPLYLTMLLLLFTRCFDGTKYGQEEMHVEDEAFFDYLLELGADSDLGFPNEHGQTTSYLGFLIPRLAIHGYYRAESWIKKKLLALTEKSHTKWTVVVESCESSLMKVIANGYMAPSILGFWGQYTWCDMITVCNPNSDELPNRSVISESRILVFCDRSGIFAISRSNSEQILRFMREQPRQYAIDLRMIQPVYQDSGILFYNWRQMRAINPSLEKFLREVLQQATRLSFMEALIRIGEDSATAEEASTRAERRLTERYGSPEDYKYLQLGRFLLEGKDPSHMLPSTHEEDEIWWKMRREMKKWGPSHQSPELDDKP